MAIMTANAYSKHRGVSGNAVKKAIQEGRITAKKNSKNQYDIDPEVADREWAENTLTLEKRKAKKEMDNFVEEKKMQDDLEVEKALEDWENEERLKLDPNAGLTLVEARRLRENYKAKHAKMQYELDLGLLISSEQVRADAFKMARLVRDQIMALPDRISSELAAMKDSRKIAEKLAHELRLCLESLVENE